MTQEIAETRSLYFPRSILKVALLRELMRGQKIAIGDQIQTIDVLEESGKIVVSLRLTVSGDSIDYRVDTKVLAAALMRYCFSEKIPLPKKAHKSLAAYGDSVALLLHLNGPIEQISSE